MIYINLEKLWDAETQAFEENAQKLVATLRQLKTAQRSAFLEAHADWSSFKNKLASLSDGKCWYDECRSTGGDRDVDHFRPKGKIRRFPDWPEEDIEPAHDGYWWLAYHWQNLRYSCRFCNSARRDPETNESGGKWNYFPIKDEITRVRREAPLEDLEEEASIILDPTDADDVDQLMFDQFGHAKPRSTEKESWAYKRVALSIKLLNLDHSDFVKPRAKLGRHIKTLIDRGSRADRALQRGDGSARARLREAKAELKDMLLPQAEFSRFCRITLRGYRHIDWVDEIL